MSALMIFTFAIGLLVSGALSGASKVLGVLKKAEGVITELVFSKVPEYWQHEASVYPDCPLN